ncbi:MAG: hypothetical protein LBK82_16055 [Planctomycetaceae bacterium]|nr:hypothetical protein [Planctomycetaceae bacterium]
MTCSFFRILTVCFFVSVFSVCVSAQNFGDIGGGIIGGGNTNTGNSGNTGNNGNTGGSNNNSSSNYSNSGSSDSTGTEFGSTIETPTFQGFQDPTSQDFIGRDSSIPFMGRVREPFTDRQTSTSNRRTVATTTTRRTTASRMTSSRSMSTARSGLNSSSANGRTVRAATQAEFALLPIDVYHRTTEFQTRITRLPNLHIIPEQIGVNLESTPQGNVATLTGAVPSERERKVMKQLLLLEPGIDKVENKLTLNGN